MEDSYQKILDFWDDLKLFFTELIGFVAKRLHFSFLRFEAGKGVLVSALYRQRGKLARRFIHTGMASLAGVAMVIAPVVSREFPGRSVNPWDLPSTAAVLSVSAENPEMQTFFSDKIRDKVIEYQVGPGDTVSSIADKFGISAETIRWQNNLVKDAIKVGQVLEILPVTGIVHKVQKGDTVYSIAKRYDSSPQSVVDFPYNTFTNDETFELAIGQIVVVPEGVKPAEKPAAPRTRQLTPNAGTVVASGNFVWPAGGMITQRFVWYHKGIDIANNAAPDILAADSGTIALAGWPDGAGYGNRVMINHGNGYTTMYAHLQAVYVVAGQTVKRGDRIGKMGSTGRSTGVHLHFEVIQGGTYLNPLNVLK